MLRALLVDDEPLALEGLKLLIDWRAEGFEICGECASGHEALQKLPLHKPDLIVTDIRMPGMSGLDLLKACRNAGFDGQFVIVSGYGDFSYAKNALQLGVAGYLLKPVDPADAATVLAHVRRDPLVSASPVFMLGRRDAWTVTESLALGALAVFDDPSHQVLQISNAVAAVMGFEERMNLEMLFDPLTGVLAAEDFRDAVDRMGEDYSLFRAGAWSLAIVTVQNFALIDDACGRQAAEGAVLAVLDLVRDLVPESATLGRLHANQIAVMLADVGADAAQELLGRLPAAAPDWSARGKDGLTYRALLVSGAVEAGGTTARETLRAAAQAVAMATPGNPGHIERYGDERADLVLLAEDSPPVARLVTLLLERVGLRVVHRDDGEAALNVALTSTDARFALIMLDLNLPTMDGFEILRRIRAEKRLANVPVVLITSSDTDRHKVAGLDAGADDYITKPFNADVFLARVRNVLRRGRVDPAAQVGAVPLDLDDEDLDDDAFEVFEGDAE